MPFNKEPKLNYITECKKNFEKQLHKNVSKNLQWLHFSNF